MATGYEVEYYQHIRNIDHSLNRIANCMEAAEKRVRARETPPVEEAVHTCHVMGCEETVVVTINDQHWCVKHIDQGFARTRAVIDRALQTASAFAGMSKQDQIEQRKQEAKRP